MRRHAAVAALLAASSLVLHLMLAMQFRRLDVFEQSNVLFDADVDLRLLAISNGRPLGIKHPNLMAYFTPPITLTARVLTMSHLAAGPEEELRRKLGTLVVPVASAGKTALIFFLFHHLGYSLAQATIATLLATLSFSTVIFGSIPESYGLSALALALGYFYAARPDSERKGWWIIVWIGIGVFATGITVSNVALVSLLLGAAFWNAGQGVVGAGFRGAAGGAAILAVTGVSAYGLDALMVRPEPGIPAESAALRVVRPLQKQYRFVRRDPLHKLGRFPTSVANSFAPPAVETMTIRLWTRGRYGLGFTLEDSPNIFGLRDPLGLSAVLLLVAGAIVSLRAPSTRAIAVASAGILSFCWLLSIWGPETFLFSQHWHLAAVVLIAGVMRADGDRPLMTSALGALTVAFAVRSFVLIQAMLATLGAGGE
jgi:hypothetical protein